MYTYRQILLSVLIRKASLYSEHLGMQRFLAFKGAECKRQPNAQPLRLRNYLGRKGKRTIRSKRQGEGPHLQGMKLSLQP